MISLKNSVPFYVYYYTNQYFYNNDGYKNIQKNILDAHLTHLTFAVNMLKINNLKSLQTEYNNRLEAQLQEFKKLLTITQQGDILITNKQQRDFLTELIKAFGYNDPSIIREIVNHLKWDKTIGAFQYTGTKLLNKDSKNSHLLKLGSTKDYHYVSTILSRIESFEKDLARFSQAQQKLVIPKLEKIKEELLQTKKTGETLEQAIARIEKTNPKIKHKKTKDGKIIDIGMEIYNQLKTLRAWLVGIENINTNLSWKFTELLGPFIATNTTIVGTNAIIQTIQNWVSNRPGTTNTKTSAIGVHLETSVDLDQAALAKLASKEEHQILYDKTNNKYSLAQLSKPAPGKLDAKAQFQIDIQDPSLTKEYNISLKNYNIYKEFNQQTQEFVTDINGGISIQSASSLLQYLQGAESAFNIQHLAQHYLNLLSTMHFTDESAHVGTNLQQQALKNLKLTMLYSALTGWGQGRTGQNANLLAIYEKSSAGANGLNRIKLFDMSTIFTQALEQGVDKAVKISPNLQAPIFKNSWVATQNGASEQGAIARSTYVLADAHSKNVAVSLSKNFLSNFVI